MTAQVKTTIQLDNTTLIAELTARGVHLMGRVLADTPALKTEELITHLVRHPEPRFRQALIPLFLRQPSYAQYVAELAPSLKSPNDEVLRHTYTAAVYLQRFWRSTLGLLMGDFPLLPDYFGQSYFALPSPDEYFGEAGLRALAEHFQQKTGYEWLSAYQTIMSLFLQQLSLDMSSRRKRERIQDDE